MRAAILVQVFWQLGSQTGARTDNTSKSDCAVPEKSVGPDDTVIHQHTFSDCATVTDPAFGSDEGSELDVGVATHNGVVSYDRWSADYGMALQDGTCADMDRVKYNRAVLNSTMKCSVNLA